MTEPDRQSEAVYRSQSFWLDTVPGRLEPRPALAEATTADVAIVGAGYTGLWTAWYLKTHAPHLDIVVLEADIAGFGASGRNGGWCTAYLGGIDGWFEDPASREGAARLQRQLFAAVDEVGRVSCLEHIDCHYDKSGHVAVAVNAHQLKREHAEVADWRARGFGREDLRVLEPEELRRRLNVDGAVGGTFMAHCAAIQPAALARGLAKAVVAKGVRLHEATPVTAIETDGLRTPGGVVRAGVTLLATEGFTDSIRGLEGRMLPIHSMMIATERLTDDEIEATGLRRRHTWNNGRHRVTYGQLTRDRRIAFGARGRYYFGSGRRTRFAPDDPQFETVRRELGRMFPVLRDKPVTHAWGGPMGVSRRLQPAVVYDRERRWGWAGGYFGDGVGAANLAGRTLADLVLERETDRCRTPWVNPPGLAAPPRRAWEPEPLRWLAIAARYRVMGLADRAEDRGSASAERWNRILERVFP